MADYGPVKVAVSKTFVIKRLPSVQPPEAAVSRPSKQVCLELIVPTTALEEKFPFILDSLLNLRK